MQQGTEKKDYRFKFPFLSWNSLLYAVFAVTLNPVTVNYSRCALTDVNQTAVLHGILMPIELQSGKCYFGLTDVKVTFIFTVTVIHRQGFFVMF